MEYELYTDDLMAELGYERCVMCGHVGAREEFRFVGIDADAPGSREWVCEECIEQD